MFHLCQEARQHGGHGLKDEGDQGGGGRGPHGGRGDGEDVRQRLSQSSMQCSTPSPCSMGFCLVMMDRGLSFVQRKLILLKKQLSNYLILTKMDSCLHRLCIELLYYLILINKSCRGEEYIEFSSHLESDRMYEIEIDFKCCLLGAI